MVAVDVSCLFVLLKVAADRFIVHCALCAGGPAEEWLLIG